MVHWVTPRRTAQSSRVQVYYTMLYYTIDYINNILLRHARAAVEASGGKPAFHAKLLIILIIACAAMVHSSPRYHIQYTSICILNILNITVIIRLYYNCLYYTIRYASSDHIRHKNEHDPKRVKRYWIVTFNIKGGACRGLTARGECSAKKKVQHRSKKVQSLAKQI